jgi:hypothetical protein
MQVIVPDILIEAQDLSLGVAGVAFAVGFLLWAFGWRGHRFWIVLAATVGTGLWALRANPVNSARPLVVALLAAVAAGALSLSLARVVAFLAGGLTVWFFTRSLMPNWNEPFISFVIGGLVGILLFRLWMIVLTSAAGALLMVYSGLVLSHQLGNVDIMALAENRAMMLNVACGITALVGVLLQLALDRRRERARRSKETESKPGSHGR